MNPKFEELKASGNLPSPSGVALEILRLTQNDDVSIDELVSLVKADPALTGRVLKLVNSSALRSDHPITSITEAILRLGINILPRLALSLSILDTQKGGNCEHFDYANFWLISLFRALAVKAIAEYVPVLVPEDAFTIGLVAEIGQLALAQIYPVEYSECLKDNQSQLEHHAYCQQCPSRAECRNTNVYRLISSEQRLFAIDQNQITLAMLGEWGLPEKMIDAVNLYQKYDLALPAQTGFSQTLASSLRLASILAGQVGNENYGMCVQPLREQLGLTNSDFTDLLKQLFQEWEEWHSVLGIETFNTMATLSPHRPTPDVGSQYGLDIMLVEDDRIQSHILSTFLNGQGHRVTKASSGEEALRMMVDKHHQVLITDYRMAPMDGIALCKALRSSNNARWVYIILITADNDNATLSKAFQAGVNDFICKPIHHPELNARLMGARNMLEIQNARHDEQESIRRYAFELAASTRRLEMLAVTDQLTCLPNRRYAITRLDQEWATFLRSGNSFAIFSLDLDHFKQVNDNYGHDVGDKVLIHFANILQSSIRTNDIACRMGGEEFIVIAPDTNIYNVATLGERIREMTEVHQPKNLGLSRLITVSIGAAITNLSTDANGWSDALKRSDQALYDAKLGGRNTFRLSNASDQRRHERIFHLAPVNIKPISTANAEPFLAQLENFSTSGLLLRCDANLLPKMNDILEIQTTELDDAQWQIAKVVRLIDTGFAVEFLSGRC